jgi:DNA repair exonuclease SbcCD nuclease subunit
VLGKQLTVNPTSWKYKHHIQSNVGLGAGNNEKSVESLQGLYAIQQQLKANGSTLTDDVDIYNTLKRITDGLGFPRVDEFFNNPEEPEETLKAENELLNNMVMQLQQQVQQMQNPLAEAETIKAQSKAETDNKNAALKIAQLQEQIRQFDVETVQTANKQQSDTALAITKMELDNNTDLPGGLDA